MSSGRPATREAILRTARALIEEKGFDVGLGEIAREAGVSRQAVYLHFAGKSDLLSALVDWVEKELRLSELLAPVWDAATGAEALRRLVTAHATIESELSALTRAMLQSQDPTAHAIQEDRMSRRYAGMREVVRRIRDDGDLAKGWTVDTATAFVWTLTSGSAYTQLVEGRRWTSTRWAKETWRLLSRGLLVSGDARSER